MRAGGGVEIKRNQDLILLLHIFGV